MEGKEVGAVEGAVVVERMQCDQMEDASQPRLSATVPLDQVLPPARRRQSRKFLPRMVGHHCKRTVSFVDMVISSDSSCNSDVPTWLYQPVENATEEEPYEGSVRGVLLQAFYIIITWPAGMVYQLQTTRPAVIWRILA